MLLVSALPWGYFSSYSELTSSHGPGFASLDLRDGEFAVVLIICHELLQRFILLLSIPIAIFSFY
jgi:hypothetical protein